ncbi:MAG: transposase, partial [Spirochaetales bacterium]|nr:transposase [Spirochaetales bacterium]
METGYVLWLAHGKKKQTVYDFIDHVGPEWMDGVEAIACDMNSDFQEAFEDRCPHIQVVYDHFHIINNFNDKVIGEVRKDEQRRLFKEGNIQAAMNLKRTKYILTSSRETLKKKDDDARKGKVIVKKGTIFKRPEVTLKEGYEAKYDSLIEENKLLFTLDVIKEKLSLAYKLKDEVEMAREISQIMDICSASGNKHMMWFRRLLDNHFEGIIAHATYKISSGKVE